MTSNSQITNAELALAKVSLRALLATVSACQDLADIALQALQRQMAERGSLIDRLNRDLQASRSQQANSQSTLKREVIHFAILCVDNLH